jgi:hypothetical protein
MSGGELADLGDPGRMLDHRRPGSRRTVKVAGVLVPHRLHDGKVARMP